MVIKRKSRICQARPLALATSIAAMFALAAMPSTSFGIFWDDQGGTTNFSEAANWAGDVVPVNGDSLQFNKHPLFGGGNEILIHDLAPLTSVLGITYSATADQFTLNAAPGRSLILTANITNNGGLSQTINIPLTLGASIAVDSAGGSLTLGGSINTNGANLAFIGNFNTQVNGPITGTGSVTFASSTATNLSGANTYSGGTTVTSGNVILESGSSLGTGEIDMIGGAIIADANVTLTNKINLGGAGPQTLAATTGNTLIVNIPNSVPGTGFNIGAGANLQIGTGSSDGIVELGFDSASIDVTSTLTVVNGTLRAGRNLEALTNAAAQTTVSSGSTLDMNGHSGGINKLAGAGTIQLGTDALSVLTIRDGLFNGNILGAGNVSFLTAGVITLSPTGADGVLINGQFHVVAGEVQLNGATAVNEVIANGGVVIGTAAGASATLRNMSDNQIDSGVNVTVNNSGLYSLNGYSDLIRSLTVNDGGSVNMGGAGPTPSFLQLTQTLTMNGGSIFGNTDRKLILGGDVTATSTTAADALITAPVDLNGDRTFIVNRGVKTQDLTTTEPIANGSVIGSKLIKDGDGILVLAGAGNTYTGETQIKGGRLVAINDASTGANTTIRFTGNGEFVPDAPNLNSTKAYRVDLGKSGRFSVGNGRNFTLSGSLGLGDGGHLAFGSAGNDGLIILSAGTITAGNTHTVSVDFGTVRNGNASGFTAFTEKAATTTVAAGATLDANGFASKIRNLQGAGLLTNASATATSLTVSAGDFSGVIENGGAPVQLIKNVSAEPGSSTLTLSGPNTYSGGTRIEGGRLITRNIQALGNANAPTDLIDGTLEVHGTLQTGDVKWTGGQIGLNLDVGDLLKTTTFTNDTPAAIKTYELDTTGLQLETYTLTTFVTQTAFNNNSFAAIGKDGSTIQGTFLVTGTEVQLTISGVQTTGNLIQNSAPVGTSTAADFTVAGQATTSTNAESNTVRTLSFSPNSSLNIFNTLTVTNGQVTLVPSSSIHLGTSPYGPATLSASQLNLLFGAALTGNGTITGNLINSGLVSPGNSPGTIYVGQNYVQTSTGTLRIEIGGRRARDHDLLAVRGTATLDGTLELVRLNNFQPRRGDKITFLTADQGVSGEFSSVSNPFVTDTILEANVVYHQDSVALEMVRGSFEDLASRFDLTPNQRSTARALDSVSADDGNNQALLYLDQRSLHELPGDFDRIAPEELSSVFTISTALAQVQGTNLQRRTDDIRHGSSGFSASGLAMQGTGPGYSGPAFRTGAAGPTGDSKETKEVKAVAPEEQRRWGAFLTGVGEWVDVSGDGNARGYDINTGGFTLGLDYKVTDNFAIGINAGYAGSKSDLANDGAVWVNGGKVGLYATCFTGGLYLDTAVTGGYNSYDTKRSALEGSARGSTEGGELNVLVGAGYDWKIGGLQIGPTATFNYTLTGMDDFTEHGSLAPLHIGSRNAESVRSAIGFKASYDIQAGSVLIRPEIRAAWQHEFGDKSYDISASFADGAGDAFLVNGPEVGRDSALLGAGFAIQFSETFSTYFYYDGELGRERYDRHSVSGGIRVAF